MALGEPAIVLPPVDDPKVQAALDEIVRHLPIGNSLLGPDSVTSANIVNATIQGVDIGNAQIVGNVHIQNASIIGSNIASATIQGGNIASATIQGSNIAVGTITSSNIQDLTIQSGDIGDLQITTAKLGNLSVTSGKIGNLEVKTANIDNLAVTSGKIGNLEVKTINLDNASVTTAKIGALQVTSAEIANLTITAGQIQNTTITAGKLTIATLSAITADLGTVTAGKVIIGTAGAAKVGIGTGFSTSSGTKDGIIGTDASNVITFWMDPTTGNLQLKGTILSGSSGLGNISGAIDGTTNITSRTISGDRLVLDTLSANEIAANAIGTTELAATSVTAGKMSVSQLSAITADMGTITAGTITGGTFQTGSGTTSVVRVDSTGLKAWDSGSVNTVFIDTTGALTVTKGTITGTTIRTAAPNADRVELTSSGVAWYGFSNQKWIEITPNNGFDMYGSASIAGADYSWLDISHSNLSYARLQPSITSGGSSLFTIEAEETGVSATQSAKIQLLAFNRANLAEARFSVEKVASGGGKITASVTDAGSVTTTRILLDSTGVSGWTRWLPATHITTAESRTNTAFGVLTTPDRVSGITCPANSFLIVYYWARFQNSVANAGSATIVLNGTRVKVADGGVAGSQSDNASNASGSAAIYNSLFTSPHLGLRVRSSGNAMNAPPSTGIGIGGDIIGGGDVGSPFVIFVPSALSNVNLEIQFKSTSGSVTVADRHLAVGIVAPA